ncbi:MAG TPA: LamG domain-containing protein [Polyangiaceae bacterium]|nr:LamG domain-containing protein [Polyangiaceae bacterium]
MFLTRRSAQSALGCLLSVCCGLAACSLQMPSESDVFGAAGAKPSGGASGGTGMLGDAGSEESGGSEAIAGSAGNAMPASGGKSSSGGSSSGGSKASGGTGSGGTKASGGATNTGGRGGSGGTTGAAGTTGASGSGGTAAFDPTAGLVAYFTFDDTGATATNTKDSTKSAKCLGTCTHPSGQLGNAFGIRNNVSPTDWIELPTGIFNGRSAITLSVWMRDLSTTRNEAPLLHFSTSTDEAFYLLPDDNQTSATGAHLVGVHSGTSFVDLASAAPSLTDKVWHQIVVCWSSAKVELYIDGNSVGSTANPKVLPSQLGASSTNYLGRSRDGSKLAMFGELDDLRLYDRVLSAADIKSLYKVR